MRRVTLRIPANQVEEIDDQVEEGRFPNRSEAIRTAVRELLEGVDSRGYQSPRGAYTNRQDDLRTDGGQETVWIKGNNRSRGGPLILHVSPDCPRLEEAKNVYEKARSVYPDDARICLVCSGGDIHRHRDGPGGLWEELEAMDADQLVTDGGAYADEDVLLYATRTGGRSTGVVHADRDCLYIRDIDDADLLEKPPWAFDPDQDTCSECADGVELPGPIGDRETATDGGRDLSLELIEQAEAFDELQDALLERGDDDARVAADICSDIEEICLRLSEVLERRESIRERFRLDDDEVLTDGGSEPVAVYTVSDGKRGPKLTLHRKACEPAGFEPDDQVLVYPREEGLVLKRADGEVRQLAGELVLEDGILTDGGVSTGGSYRLPPARGSWYDAEWVVCPRCRGDGQNVECIDDLCHAQGRCMHGDNLCALCEGVGEISRELERLWTRREPFESVTLPDQDLRRRGKLHEVARERYQDTDSCREGD